jgi:hypothetical protein
MFLSKLNLDRDERTNSTVVSEGKSTPEGKAPSSETQSSKGGKVSSDI